MIDYLKQNARKMQQELWAMQDPHLDDQFHRRLKGGAIRTEA